MKRAYTAPELEITAFETEDVIADSDGNQGLPEVSVP